MIRHTYCGILLLLFLCPGFSAWAQSSEQEVRSFLENRDRDIKKAVQKLSGDTHTQADRDYASALINDQIDFKEMGRLALGKYWEEITPENREEFIDVFSTIVRAQSLSDLSVYNAAVTFHAVEVNGEKAYVRTTADVDGVPLKVEYMLRRGEGNWWLYDIILDGVGTVEGYAISFQSYIRKRGFEKFMASLLRKRERLQTKR